MNLSEAERARLVVRLAESLGAPDPHAALSDEELAAEIQRRAEAAASGGSAGDRARAAKKMEGGDEDLRASSRGE